MNRDDSSDGNGIDLNADAGESFGSWSLGNDGRLFGFLSSVNLACGMHAGDPVTMRRSVRLAAEHGVRVGAHPGFRDLEGFGRRDMTLSAEELHALVVYQLGALQGFLALEGSSLAYVKPHGALYLRMARDEATADAVTAAVRDFDARLPIVVLGGPGGAVMRAAAERYGVRAVPEAFPDRAYHGSGLLAGRSTPGALVLDPAETARRAVAMARGEPFPSLDGEDVVVEARTLCIHGDNPEAPSIARAVRDALESAGIPVRPF